MLLPSLRQLLYLVALAETHHFGRAAAQCNVTQSTLSAGIKELESVLGAPLVDRTRRSVVLTPLGQDTVERARHLIDAAGELVAAARVGSEPLSGTLRLGVIPTIAPFLLPKVLPRLRRRYPKLRLYLREEKTPTLVEQLQAGRLDAGLLALPCDCGSADRMPLFRDPFLFAAPPNHPLARRKVVKPEDLSSEQLLLLEDGHCLRDQALAACELADRRQIEPFAATSLQTLVPMVESGLGVTLLPKLAVDGGLLRGSKLVTVPLAGDNAERSVGLAWRKGSARRPDFERLGEEIRAVADGQRGREAA
jgi:LysR family hydrogen peroxide-inducible transcriptional activator